MEQQTYPRYELVYVSYGYDYDNDGNEIGAEQFLGHLLKIQNDEFEADHIEEYIESDMIFTPEDAAIYLSETARFAKKTMTDEEFNAYKDELR